MIHITTNKAYTDDPTKKIRRKGTDDPEGRSSMTLLQGDTADSFEEFTPEPAPLFTEQERAERIVSLIRQRYSADEEDAIRRKAIAAILNGEPITLENGAEQPKWLTEFNAYNYYAEECKVKATEQLTAEKEAQRKEVFEP